MILFLWQWLLPISDITGFKWVKNTKLTSFMDAYHAPYRAKSRYWTGFLLLCRVVLYTTSAVNVSGDPSINLIAVIVVITCLFMLKFDIYKQWPINVLETGTYVNLLLLSAGKFYVLYNELGTHALLAYVSTSISIIIFLCVISYHILYNTPLKTWITYVKCTGISRPILHENLTTALLDGDGHSGDPCLHSVTFSEVMTVKCELQSQQYESQQRETKGESACQSRL